MPRLPPNTSAVLPLDSQIHAFLAGPCRIACLAGLLHGRLSAAEANQYRARPADGVEFFLIFAASSADLAKAFQPESLR